MKKNVLVIGGGIAGVQAALDLAQMGVRALLVEEQPSIGGRMAQLDKTFPTNDCSTCILAPKLVELASHPNAEIAAYSTVESVTRRDGVFDVTIRRRARYVDESKCTACGLCAEKCPVKIPDTFNRGIVNAKCIGIPNAQAIPAVYTIRAERCLYLTKGTCGNCKKVCPSGAIDYEQKDRLETFEAAAIIVATGGEEYSPRMRPEYGYGLYPNVITSIEYERLLSASGPTEGQVLRPSDGQHAKRIAFVQCVGSRDVLNGDRGYCSAYCCMQATKEAMVTWEHDRDAHATIFQIDLRAFGKGFDKFADRAKEQCGVQYVRSRIAEVLEQPATKNLIVKYAGPDQKVAEQEFDLVVLSVGLSVPEKTRALLARLGVTPDEHGFCPGGGFTPGATNVKGIYVCGTLAGPMDIPETVISAGSAAADAVRGLLDGKAQEPAEETPVPPPASIDESPRIGVVVCRCGINIASVVDVPATVERAKNLPNVRYAEEMTYACSQDSLRKICDRIREHGLNRLVVASCSPRTHEKVFRGALRDAGLNEHLLQMTNIRDQCSWVHRDEPEAATEKAQDLVAMAVGKARLLAPLPTIESDVRRSALVIGGGVAGMKAALCIAEAGFPVHLLEREGRLGGNALEMQATLDIPGLRGQVNDLIAAVRGNSLITVCENAELRSISGCIGQFTTKFAQDGEEKTVEHGVVIIATGARERVPSSYSYGTDPYIVTQRQFGRMLADNHPMLRAVETVAMIQCVESREAARPGCSRTCCGEAVKNVLLLKKLFPKKEAVVFYRDMRTYGLLEPKYAEARKAGGLFIRYEPEAKPAIARNGRGDFTITAHDELAGQDVEVRAQLVVLSAGMDPEPGNRALAQMVKVPLDEEGWFREAHVKLRPAEFATDGVFLCGLAHGPKHVGEAIAHAQAAAGRALTVLTRDKIRSDAVIAAVNRDRCTGCGICVSVCPYSAIEIADGTAKVNELVCKGCGNCASACLSAAVDLRGFTNKQIVREFEELLVE